MGKLVGVVALLRRRRAVRGRAGVRGRRWRHVADRASASGAHRLRRRPARGRPCPTGWAALEQSAAATCPGLSWSVLAAIGTVESDSGRSTAPGRRLGRQPGRGRGSDPVRAVDVRRLRHRRARAAPAAPPPTTRSTPCTRPPPLLCADGGGSPRGLRRRGVRLQPRRRLRGHRADPLPGLRRRPDRRRHGRRRAGLRRRPARHPLPLGRHRPGRIRLLGLCPRRPSPMPGSALPRVAQDQFAAGPAGGRGRRVRPGDLVFFGSGRPASTTSASTSATGSWSTPRTPAPWSGWSRPTGPDWWVPPGPADRRPTGGTDPGPPGQAVRGSRHMVVTTGPPSGEGEPLERRRSRPTGTARGSPDWSTRGRPASPRRRPGPGCRPAGPCRAPAPRASGLVPNRLR